MHFKTDCRQKTTFYFEGLESMSFPTPIELAKKIFFFSRKNKLILNGAHGYSTEFNV